MLDIARQKGAQALTLAEQASLYMVFALGALVNNDSRAETFYKEVRSVALDVIEETSMESAIVGFLICLYQQTTGRLSAAWTTFAAVVRIAQSLGCSDL